MVRTKRRSIGLTPEQDAWCAEVKRRSGWSYQDIIGAAIDQMRGVPSPFLPTDVTNSGDNSDSERLEVPA